VALNTGIVLDCAPVGVLDLLGGDSAGVDHWSLDIRVRRDVKVFRREGPGALPWVMGFTTSFRMGQLLHHKLDLPDVRVVEDHELEHFMVTRFVDAVREALKGGGWATKENEHESAGQFLVGVRGRLFEIEGDYQVAETVDAFSAVGGGASYALGSLATTEGVPDIPATARIQQALAAAERFSAGVRGPVNVVVTTTT
jgi:hypothetical protein